MQLLACPTIRISSGSWVASRRSPAALLFVARPSRSQRGGVARRVLAESKFIFTDKRLLTPWIFFPRPFVAFLSNIVAIARLGLCIDRDTTYFARNASYIYRFASTGSCQLKRSENGGQGAFRFVTRRFRLSCRGQPVSPVTCAAWLAPFAPPGPLFKRELAFQSTTSTAIVYQYCLNQSTSPVTPRLVC